MTKKVTEDDWRAGERISDARGLRVKRSRIVGDGSVFYSPPCNRCSFYQGAAACAFYTTQIPSAFLIGAQVCGRYVKRGDNDTEA